MKTIWKFEVKQHTKHFHIEMPKDAEILCIQKDEKTNKPCIWAIVDTENQLEKRYFELNMTGEKMIINNRKYLGTYQLENGKYVLHIFEIYLVNRCI